MGYTQQTLVAAPEDESRVIDSFVEASREINPTVQVTLAKRIVRPGSNKVLCLAARTSVPLNEDEMASVSDLALRLSDGTNVKLSLSFFNDEYGVMPLAEQPVHRAIAGPSTPCISMSRSFFDPHRYTPYQSRNESKLGMAIFTVVLGIAAGLYFVTESPYALLKAARVKAASIMPGQAALHKATPTQAAKTASRIHRSRVAASEKRSPAPKESKPASDSMQIVQDAPKQVSRPRYITATNRSAKIKRPIISSESSETNTVKPEKAIRAAKMPKSMFIPPPPPTLYTIDPAMYPPYMQWQTPVSPKVERTAKRPVVQNPLADLEPVAAGTRNPIPSSTSNAQRTPSINALSAVRPSGNQTPNNAVDNWQGTRLNNAMFDRSAAQTLSNSIANGENAGGHPAPVPGADQVNFERIRIPGQ